MRDTTPSGNNFASDFFLVIRSILQIGQIAGHPEITPGSMGQKYSVSPDTTDSIEVDLVKDKR